MEHKTFKFEVKSVNELEGVFEGYASVFRKIPDKVGDIVDSGAFRKTINDNKGEVVLDFLPHDLRSPVGLGTMSEDGHGLKITGKLTRGVVKAEEALLHMKAGVIKTMSIGYDVVKSKVYDGARHLQELKIIEIGLVPGVIAADDQAVITGVKAQNFDDNLATNQLRSQGYRMLDTLCQTVDGIMGDYESADKVAALEESITQFHDAFLDWVKAMIDAGHIKVDAKLYEEKTRELRTAFKALLKPEEVKTEPLPSTPPTPSDDGAATLDSITARFHGQNEKKVEARFDTILQKIKGEKVK